jgi:hypothetical protein
MRRAPPAHGQRDAALPRRHQVATWVDRSQVDPRVLLHIIDIALLGDVVDCRAWSRLTQGPAVALPVAVA